MQIEFSVPMRAFSINAYHYRDKRHKTPEARDWEQLLYYRLKDLPELELLKAHVDTGTTFSVNIAHIYPESEYYTKQGHISARTYDLSNTEKPIIDVIFGQVLEVDDKFVVKLVSTKRPGPNHALEIKIELNPL